MHRLSWGVSVYLLMVNLTLLYSTRYVCVRVRCTRCAGIAWCKLTRYIKLFGKSTCVCQILINYLSLGILHICEIVSGISCLYSVDTRGRMVLFSSDEWRKKIKSIRHYSFRVAPACRITLTSHSWQKRKIVQKMLATISIIKMSMDAGWYVMRPHLLLLHICSAKLSKSIQSMRRPSICIAITMHGF